MIAVVGAIAAQAAQVQRTFCVEAQVAYEDVGLDGALDDYFETNANRPLRGARLLYKQSNVANFTAVYVNDGATDPGCVTLTLDDTFTYDIKIVSRAVVSDHTIHVVNSNTGNPWERAWANRSIAGAGTVVLTVGPHRAWDVLAASSFALYRRDGGLPATYGPTFRLTDDAGVLTAPPSCGNASCVVGSNIYLTDDLAHRKFPIVFAMGRTFLNEMGLAASDVNAAANNEWCGDSSATLALNSIEHDSAAAVAGYAWFYAATVFNNTLESDCGLVSQVAANWDLLGDPSGDHCFLDEESPADHPLSCADGPTLVPRRNQLQYCEDRYAGNSPAAHRGVPIDWVRFLWELQSTGAEDFATITQAYKDAVDSGSWSATGGGVQAAFSAAGGLLDVHGALAQAHGVKP